MLQIRCPSCGRKFKVDGNLRGKTVQCGSCEQQFRIADEAILRAKRIYPGENRDAALGKFPRIPEHHGKRAAATVEYAPAPPPAAFEPATPLQIIAGIIGAAGMIFTALYLLFGTGYGGMDGQKRLILAGFAAVLGFALLLYANPRARLKAALVGVLMAAGLIAIPLLRPGGGLPAGDGKSISRAEEAKLGDRPSDSEKELRSRLDLGPLDKANAALKEKGATHRVTGIWIHNLLERNKTLVRDHLQRLAKSDLPPDLYVRGNDSHLIVFTETKIDLPQLAAISETLGEIRARYPEAGVIELDVDNALFVEVSAEKLSDTGNPAFYDLNKNELSNVDPNRIKAAVLRLTAAEPKLFRPDISARLTELLGMKDIDFKPEIARALIVWAETPGPAGTAALAEIRRQLADRVTVSRDFAELAVKENPPGTLDVIMELWKSAPAQWESFVGRLGRPAEKRMLRELPAARDGALHSVVRVLGQCGGSESLEALTRITPGSDRELAALIGKCTALIRERQN